jgi:hypothetical protein
MSVKIPPLLAQYLFCHKRLDLPGIGTFLLDNAAISALENSKQRSALLDGVSFKSNSSLKETPELVAFIAQKTGKMKALAASDLDSHLRIAEQFLNIGKPFTLEGIGIISKGNKGEMEFTPITVLTDKVKEYNTKETEQSSPGENSSGEYESFLSPSKVNLEWKKPVIGLFLICGIGLTIWGGYEISKKANRNKPGIPTQASIIKSTVLVVPDSNLVQNNDSIDAIQSPLPAVDNNYKYILEIAKSKRAFKRYNQLKSIQWNVQLETKDSVQYKLFMLLPAISDTTRTIDSLTATSGRKVYIEYPN